VEPLLRLSLFERLEIFESHSDAAELSASIGHSDATDAQTKPLRFETQDYGELQVFGAHLNFESRSQEITEPLAALFAWKEMPWPQRLTILSELHNLRKRYEDFNWIGIYRRMPGTEDLVVSCYIGEPTEHIRIPVSNGICGAAIRENKSLNIENVRADPRFIACSIKTRSELVVPIRNQAGEAIAEIDIDSNKLAAFSPDKVAAVEALASKLSKLNWN